MAESNNPSVFESKYNEFVEDVLGALPEYTAEIQVAKELDHKTRLARFQEEVKVRNTLAGSTEDVHTNPGTILPGVTLTNAFWATLSDHTKKAIWEHVRIVSICCFMEAGFNGDSKPSWMDDAMDEMKKKLESTDFQDIIKKFMKFFTLDPNDATGTNSKSDQKEESKGAPDLKGLFENGFPKLPEKFLKGHLAKLAQEIVKEIKPDDLGITPEMLKACEKDPSRAFNILISTFSDNPGIIQRTIARIGHRLQKKVQSGAIRPDEIAREAEELMKEFAENSSFVDMMKGVKSAFGMEDMDVARAAGREGSARLSMARDRLRKKLEKKQQMKDKK
jgi:hypothetical protein